MNTKTRNMMAAGLLTVGSTAMLGHTLGVPWLKGLGLASTAAPFTKVFCAAEAADDGRSFETFAAEFTLRYRTPNGGSESLAITPEVYGRLAGPYNRRNVYGAVLAYGPALPPALREATLRYALVEPGVVARDLGLPTGARDFEVVVRSLTAGSDAEWVMAAQNGEVAQ